jgi:outer membrane protein OmpA-like peptidoglycan-associated protein
MFWPTVVGGAILVISLILPFFVLWKLQRQGYLNVAWCWRQPPEFSTGEATMNSRYVRVVAATTILFLFSCLGLAQQECERKWTAPTLDGTTGLFKTWDADNLRQGEFNMTFGYDMFNRDPGRLKIGRAPAGGAVGIADRFELFGSMDVIRRIRASNTDIYRLVPGQLPLPATVAGVPYFTQVGPFIDVPLATGRSDIHLGVKVNLLSERRGNGVSLGLAGFGTIPTQKSITGLNRGLSNGAYEGGLALLLSKTAANFVRFHVNLGTGFYTDSETRDIELLDPQNEFIYRGGIEFPVHKPYRFIVELNGREYYGDSRPGFNQKSPMDVIAGLRVFPTKWMSLGAGYQASFNRGENPLDRLLGSQRASHNGFVVQLALEKRRNDPPTVTIAVDKPSILQGDTTAVRANAMDPDCDKLTYAWTASGGKISGTGDTATFDATGLAPGKYTVMVTVSDGKHRVSSSADVTVLKRNHAPTATVEPGTFEITEGESANLRCVASDPDNDPLTYSWSVDGQNLAAAGPQITFGSEGRKPGIVKIACAVSDGEASATASSTGTIRARVIPNHPPAIECLTTTMDVASGGSIDLKARASDPDGDKLTYTWSSTGGTVTGNGEAATFNASGAKAGSYTVTVTVDDGRGGKASCTMTVNVSERLSITREDCGYFAPGKFRVDNCAKAILDDLAVRMKNDPKLRANVIGYTDDSRIERSRKNLGETRAKAMAEYLEKQGVEESRITITNGGTNNPVSDKKTVAGQKLNRRVEIELTVR